MALTKELLKANQELTALSDEQLNAIVTLSNNDENTVIAQKVGEIYGGLDNDILATSGIGKNGTEKTYEYAKRVIGEIKAKAESVDELNGKIDSLTKENAKLQKTIAEGSTDAEAAKQLKQAKADLSAITTAFNDLKKVYDESEAKHQAAIIGLQVEGELNAATSGLKFKSSIPESATKVLLQQAIAKVRGMNPEFIDNGNGGKTLVFKGDNGEIMRNKEKQLNPYTAADLLLGELNAMGIVDNGRQQNGGGTTPPPAGNPSGGAIDVSGARTQNEAQEIIAQALMAKGLTNGSAKFQEEMTAAWKENNVSSLPIK